MVSFPLYRQLGPEGGEGGACRADMHVLTSIANYLQTVSKEERALS